MSSDTPISTAQDALTRSGIDRSLRHPVMFFLMSGSAWLAISMLLGLISSVKIHNPDFMSDCATMSLGRVYAAHVNTLVYGWGMQAAFAMILWLMARLSGKECSMIGSILTAGHLWNIGIAIGVVGILAGFGTGMPWMEFPPFAWPVLLVAYAVIVIGSFIQFRVRPEGGAMISQWYLLAAMIWFPWVYLTANILLHCIPGHPVMAAGINAWFKSGMVFLFFTPVALGTVYYITPKVTGLPIFSNQLAKIGFWSLAIIAPWAGMQKLAGAPIPIFLPYVGGAATALIFIPACAAAVNNLRSILANRETLALSPALRFTFAGLISLVILVICGVFLNLPNSTLKASQFSMAGYSAEILAMYGFFSFVIFGAAYFIVPRVTRREWLSRRLIRWHFLFSVYGIITVAAVALIGGYLQGTDQENWELPWMTAAQTGAAYAVAITFAWCMILLSNFFFFIHLTLMWLRLGRRGPNPTLLTNPHAADALDSAAH